jgi:hypothetical protein
MIFTLEALEAKHGDSLLLHYGTKSSPKLVVVDGGPPGTFNQSLRPRLEGLRDKRTPGKPLPVRMLMVSHIDDDHIRGVLDLTGLLLEQKGKEPLLCKITTLWHNSFDEILGNKEANAIPASLGPSVRLSASGELTFPSSLFRDEGAAAVAASVAQGRQLRDNAVAGLSLRLNTPYEGLVSLLPKQKTHSLGGGLKFRTVWPSKARLEKLEADWDAKLKELQKKPPAQAKALAAAFMDDSVYNLSSIVVLAEAGGKKMLLTGDALADDVLEGLKAAKLLKEGGTLHVDILKMPHHGSRRNMTEEFLSTVTADHYVMSANGKHNHPDLDTLKMFSKVRGDSGATVHLTNAVPHAVKFLKADVKKAGKNYKLNIREDPARSIRIDLGEPFKD